MSSTTPIPVISSASIKNIDVVTVTVITHVVVHVISVLGVIDALFAAVKHILTGKSSCRIISIQETLVVDKVLMRIHVF